MGHLVSISLKQFVLSLFIALVLLLRPITPAYGHILDFSTYLGGSQFEQARDIALDPKGNIVVVGGTLSINFPRTLGPALNTGACNTIGSGGKMDVYISKFSPSGQLLWSRLWGGPCYDRAYAVEIDVQGNIYIGGRAGAGLPTTSGVIQTNFGGDSTVNTAYGQQDGFIAKFSPDGSQVIWATYFGGNDKSFFRDIDIDNQGNVYGALTAVTLNNPHITSNAFQSSRQGAEDGVITKISADGTKVLWATYLGGSNNDIITPAIRVYHPTGDVYVSGSTNSTNMPTSPIAFDKTLAGKYDQYVAKFTSGGQFLWGNYLGGSEGEYGDTHNLALDSQGNAIATDTTLSSNFPTTTGSFQPNFAGTNNCCFNQSGDGFIAKIKADGSQLIAATYVGGSLGDGSEGISVDNQDRILISGGTHSPNFPLKNPFQSKLSSISGGTNQQTVDMFVSLFSADLKTVQFSTYLGGGITDRGLSSLIRSDGNAFYLIGETESSNFPTKTASDPTHNGNFDVGITAFSAKLSTSPTPTPPPATPLPLAGDFDHDGDVDFPDLKLLRTAFGISNCALNLTGSCVIDIFDYAKFATL